MRKIYTICLVLITNWAYSQVGINTENPQATLDIAVDAGKGDASFMNGGMILGYPGENKNSIQEITVPGLTSLSNQQLLMRDKSTGQVNYMDRYAIDYYPARPSVVPIFGNLSNQVNDHTILVRDNFTLSNGPEFIGKTLYLIYDSQTNVPFKISGAMKYNAYLSEDLTEGIYLSRVNSGYVLQSDGEKWFVLGGFEQEDNKEVELVTLYENDTVQVNDNKILVKGNINLPDATVAGYELTLTYNGDGTETFTITGNIDDGGTISTTFAMSTASNQRAIKLQSDGTNWVVLAKR